MVSVELGCAFIKHNYWYLLPSRIQSARLDFNTSVPWKGIALHMCAHTPRVCGQKGPHGLRSSLGEHRGTSSNGNKHTHTHTPLLPSLSCSVRSVMKPVGRAWGKVSYALAPALGLPWTCTGMSVGGSH